MVDEYLTDMCQRGIHQQASVKGQRISVLPYAKRKRNFTCSMSRTTNAKSAAKKKNHSDYAKCAKLVFASLALTQKAGCVLLVKRPSAKSVGSI
jgi:hypothetical protein